MTTFERIKELSAKRGKSVKEVAGELGFGENYFYSLNSGKSPTAEKLEKVADYFGVSVDYLLGRTEIDWTKFNDMLTPEHLEAIDRVEMESKIENLIHMPVNDEIQEEELEDAMEDKNYFMIQRKAIKMTPEQRRKTLKILEATFDDDSLWDD